MDVSNLTRAEPYKCSGEADMSKDTSCPESPEELRRNLEIGTMEDTRITEAEVGSWSRSRSATSSGSALFGSIFAPGTK
ncbi:hypothetical protein Tco_0531535 [Tanacetum coccineum]